MNDGLTKQEVMIIVNRWIGVSGGYLGDFSYRTHDDFYPEYCDLEFDPYELEGTTRERFIEIVSNAKPRDQTRIVRGVLERFPLEQDDAPTTRNEQLLGRLLSVVARIERTATVTAPNLRLASGIVERAIDDAESLMASSGATSSVDRIHTALHGFLLAICEAEGIEYPADASLTKLFKIVRNRHPAFTSHGHRHGDISKILNATASIMDALQPIRNRASVAHPNEQLLDRPEAILVINSAKTLLAYLDEKLAPHD